jgi:DNA modification methylase
MMELDEKYCDVIIKRWQNLTDNDAVLESNGRLFSEFIDGEN